MKNLTLILILIVTSISFILSEAVETKKIPKQFGHTVKQERTNSLLSAVIGKQVGKQVGKRNIRKSNTMVGAIISDVIANKHNPRRKIKMTLLNVEKK